MGTVRIRTYVFLHTLDDHQLKYYNGLVLYYRLSCCYICKYTFYYGITASRIVHLFADM